MDYLKKNKFFSYFAVLICVQFIIGLTTVYFLGFHYLPKRSLHEKKQQCLHHLEDKAYLLKQFFLENINNAGLWAYAQQNSFFDSKWLGVAFYEHNGSEWILKNFQINSVLLDLYNIQPGDYVKFEQRIKGPHPDAKQISLHDGLILDQKLLVLESANSLRISSPHLIRVSMMSDQVTSILDSDASCPLALFDPKGSFLLNKGSDKLNSYIFSNQESEILSNDVYQNQINDYISLTKKILKNVSVVQFIESTDNNYAPTFAQILFFNFCGLFISTYVAFRVLRSNFHLRLRKVKQLIRKFSEDDYSHTFSTEALDELSELDEALSEMKDSHKRRNRN